MKNITRKEFLRACGTVLAGGSIAGVTVLLSRRYANASQQAAICNNTERKKPNCSNCTGCPFQN